MKKLFLYLMIFMYASAGIYHFINPGFYEAIMPAWLPCHAFLNYAGGVAELILAVLLLSDKTRKPASILIVVMLIIFLFLIHIPMTVHFYRSNHPDFIISVIRLPLQFLLIWWAWLYKTSFKT